MRISVCVGECACQIDKIKLDLAMFSKTSLEVSKLFHNLEDEKDDLFFFLGISISCDADACD